jgi:hypothetical protein
MIQITTSAAASALASKGIELIEFFTAAWREATGVCMCVHAVSCRAARD